MAPNAPKEDPGQPADRLAPPLDSLVERIAAQEPPEEVVQQSLRRVRQARPSPPDRPSPRTYRRLTMAVTVATAVGLACVSLAWWINQGGPDQVEIVEQRSPGETQPPICTPRDETEVEKKPELPPPTFWAYHQAALRSPEALESLLDEHAQEYAFGGLEVPALGITIHLNGETL